MSLGFSYLNFQRRALFVFWISVLIVSNGLAAHREIISAEAESEIPYREEGDDVTIFYRFRTQAYSPEKQPQTVELYKLRDHFIGRAFNQTFQVVSPFDSYISVNKSEYNMSVVISEMDQSKEGEYQLIIESDDSRLNHTTAVIKMRDACTEDLQGPLTEITPERSRWPLKIKSLRLCSSKERPSEENTFNQGLYCVKNTETPTDLRFAFEYYEHPDSVRERVTGFVFYEVNPYKERSQNYLFGISMDAKTKKYRRHERLNSIYNVAPYYSDNGIAFRFNFTNSTECTLTYIGLTMRKEGKKNVFMRFALRTDCHGNGCADFASTQTAEAHTVMTDGTSVDTPEYISVKPSGHSGGNLQSGIQTAVIMAAFLVSQILSQSE